MAFSRRSTTLAVLRGILGPLHGQEARFARLLGRSVSWVKKVSSGIEPLTEKTALLAEARTGISAAWLLKRSTASPPVSPAGTPYDFAAFEQHRARPNSLSSISFPSFMPAVAGIASSAQRKGRASLFNYRLARFIEDCQEEFGFDKPAAESTKTTAKSDPRRPTRPPSKRPSRINPSKIPEPEPDNNLDVHLL